MMEEDKNKKVDTNTNTNTTTTIYDETDITFDQKPYSENYPYNMVKMAAVEPVCFYPNRKYVNEFNNRKLNMKKLADYLYDEKKGNISGNKRKMSNSGKEYQTNTTITTTTTTTTTQKDKENSRDSSKEDSLNQKEIIFKIYQPYYLPEFYNSTFVHQMPLVDILPAERIHESKRQYECYEKLHYEEPAWTQAEKDLFNRLYKTIGKDFHKMAKEFEDKATTLVIPSYLLKKSKINITDETEDNIMASVTPLPSSGEEEEEEEVEDVNDLPTKSKKRKYRKTKATTRMNTSSRKKNKMMSEEEEENVTADNPGFHCQALPNIDDTTIHLLVQNLEDVKEIMPRDDMIFPRKTAEIIHFYYKNKFNIPNWKTHKSIKATMKKNKTKIIK